MHVTIANVKRSHEFERKERFIGSLERGKKREKGCNSIQISKIKEKIKTKKNGKKKMK